jgi:hypothetical protein
VTRAAALLLALLLGACVTVRPWQRERLARRAMEPDGHGASSGFQAHVASVRFGDPPAGGGGGGGGCGCR